MKIVMPMPVSEMWDRAQICAMKLEAMPDSSEARSWEEFGRLADEVQRPVKGVTRDLYNALWDANRKIWLTENDIRTGAAERACVGDGTRRHNMLAQIGELALKVRDLNRERCRIKGEINKIFGDCWGEAKHNYGSVL